KRIYRRVSVLQDAIGTVTDHATVKRFLEDWMEGIDDTQQKAFLEGVLLAEAKVCQDLRRMLDTILGSKEIRQLAKEFSACCGVF
ncbi:MAG: hypothetical protein ACYC6Y_14195, partial [Thermoguttaceae bacterium]